MASHESTDALLQTPLHGLHVRLGAKMAPFGGYDMPINYPAGILQEHLHTRSAAGLFDVSHMGQAILSGPDASTKLERLVPGDLVGLAEGRIRYTQLLDSDGNILDDLMVTRISGEPGGHETLFLVVNAGTKDQDFAILREAFDDLRLQILADRGLVALQGPKAAQVLATILPGHDTMPFMSMTTTTWRGVDVHISRSGYTGEDGYEISVPANLTEAFAEALLAHDDVKPIGLGARDSLRLEAGLCLYGHDIDRTTTPVEAGLLWSISKRRREQGGFPGDERVRLQIVNGPSRKRVGIKPEGRAPAREGADIHTESGELIGCVTSGGFGPSVNGPVAMGYVEAAHAKPGTKLHLMVRGKPLAATIVALPFVPAGFYRGA